MISTNLRRACLLSLALPVVLAGCDKSGKEEKTEADESPASDAAPQAGEEAPAAADETAEAEAAGEADVTEGKFSFTVDGEAKSFEYLPKDKNMAMSSTLMMARPDAGTTEEFTLVATNLNLATAELPMVVELGLGKAMREGGDPAQFAKKPKVTVEYVSPEGVQYRGFATTTFESYEGGVAKGKIEDLELGTVKPKDRGEAPVKVEGLVFEVKL